MANYKLISADSHIVEPPDLWLKRIDRRYRDRAPRLVVEDEGPGIPEGHLERVFELFTGTHIASGNTVEPALNGDGVYPRLWADLRSAQKTITMQMYYSLPGKVADTVAAILKERARAKVRVLFLIDAFGSQHMSDSYLDSMRAAGVEVASAVPMKEVTGSTRTASPAPIKIKKAERIPLPVPRRPPPGLAQ